LYSLIELLLDERIFVRFLGAFASIFFLMYLSFNYSGSLYPAGPQNKALKAGMGGQSLLKRLAG